MTDLESWEDSDAEFRSSTPIFTSDDELYPPTLSASHYVPPVLSPLHSSSGVRTVIQAAFKGRTLVLDDGFARGTAFGQRKQRRFQNDFLFSTSSIGAIPREWGMSAMNPTMAALCAQLEELDMIEQSEFYESIFEQLRRCDAKLLEAFFEGENAQPRQKLHLLADSTSISAPSIKPRPAQESVDVALGRIDKRTRRQLQRAVEFVSMIEGVILDKSTYLDCGVVCRFAKGHNESVLVSLDSAFLRRLAHGVAQFYCIQSRTVKDDKGVSQVLFSLNTKSSHKPSVAMRLSAYLDSRRAARCT